MSALIGVDRNTLWRRLWLDDLAGCLPFTCCRAGPSHSDFDIAPMPLDADVLAWRSCIGAPTARFGRHVQCHELLGTHRHWTGADIGGHISTTVGVHEPIFSLPQPDADQVGVELMNPGHARHRGPWLTARRHDLSLEFVAVFTTCTAFDCTHENVHLEVKWASSGALKWGARWEDWPLTNSLLGDHPHQLAQVVVRCAQHRVQTLALRPFQLAAVQSVIGLEVLTRKSSRIADLLPHKWAGHQG